MKIAQGFKQLILHIILRLVLLKYNQSDKVFSCVGT